MTDLFAPASLGNLTLRNRFVHSATFECMADEKGLVTQPLLMRYRTLAKGRVGLIIPGYLYIDPRGKAFRGQTAIDRDETLPGLSRLTRVVHDNGGQIAFQLAHAGRQADPRAAGGQPLAPSGFGRDPAHFSKPRVMSKKDIFSVVEAFGRAAYRAREAGADAVQLHAAHGYLLCQFLSPFFNRRSDQYGGSPERRFRILGEVYEAVRRSVGPDFPILVKLNTDDHTPRPGITPDLAVDYAIRLAALEVAAVEVSSGTYYSFHTVRGEVPAEEMARPLPWWMRLAARIKMRAGAGGSAFQPHWHLEAAKSIRPVLGETKLMLVGGMRTREEMEDAVNSGAADFISLSRPLIREPFLVKRLEEKKQDEASCTSCNKCFAAIFNHLPVRCYSRGLPPA